MSSFTCEPSEDKLYDCIIIGSGLSGLKTAHDLIHVHGVPSAGILILEAQDYVGGRVKQCSSFLPSGHMVELGAEMLHGEKTLLTEFAEEQKIALRSLFCWAQGDGGPMPEPVDGCYALYYLRDSRRLLRFDSTDPEFVYLGLALKALATLQPSDIPEEASLHDYLARQGCSAEMLGMAEAGYANTACGSLRSLSLKQVVRFSRQWDTEGEGDGDFQYPQTFKVLIDHLKRDVRCLTSCAVQRLGLVHRRPDRPDLWEATAAEDWRMSFDDELLRAHPSLRAHMLTSRADADPQSLGSAVQLETCRGVFRARCCVVTAPLHVLQTPQLLRFEPPLPRLLESALDPESVCMEPAVKVLLRFSQRVWPRGLQGLILSARTPASTPSDTPSSGPSAADTSSGVVPEVWFSCVACETHARATQGAALTARSGCARCEFYCTVFATSRWAQTLLALPSDEAVRAEVLRDLDEALQGLRDEHCLHLPDPQSLGASSKPAEASGSGSGSGAGAQGLGVWERERQLSADTLLGEAAHEEVARSLTSQLSLMTSALHAHSAPPRRTSSLSSSTSSSSSSTDESDCDAASTGTSSSTSSSSSSSSDSSTSSPRPAEAEDAKEAQGSSLLRGARPSQCALGACLVQRWTAAHAPFVGGGYAALRAHARRPVSSAAEAAEEEAAYNELLAHVRLSQAQGEAAVLFAGEHANAPAGATAHGALESAVRAARRVAVLLGPHCRDADAG